MKNFLKSASAFVLMLGAAVMLFTACDKKGGNSGGNGDVDKTKLEALIIECEALLDGAHILVSRTGYTGEDGFEIYAPAEAITGMWDALIESGRVKPCGLGCRDTLRFEVGLPLYGNELADDISPVEASLSMFAKLDKPQFIGRDTVARQKAEGPKRRIVGLEVLDRAIPRHGYEVLTPDGRTIGHITTGYRGISVDKSIAMAMVDADCAATGTQLEVQIRRKRFPAVVTSRKFYKKSYKK